MKIANKQCSNIELAGIGITDYLVKINEKFGFIHDKTYQPEVSQEFKYN